MDIFSQTKKTSPRHTHTQFDLSLDEMSKRSFKQQLFESDLEKAQLRGRPLFSSANADGNCIEPHHLIASNGYFGIFSVTVAFKRRRFSSTLVGR